MGIPKYFKYITKNNPEVIKESLDRFIQNLFFDLNCLIHPCVHKVIASHPDLVKEHNQYQSSLQYTDLDFITRFEQKIYEEIDEYLQYLIDFAKPTEMIYLSIDGVAPRAKMEQQRTRRYRSIKEKMYRKKINKKYNLNIPTFDTNCITPGTIFMKKLSNHLEVFIKTIDNVTIILDDAGRIGEGEHKILQYMKTHHKEDINCIYGLDADLIMLSLISQCEVYLMRESVAFGKVDSEKLLMFDVNCFKGHLYEHITKPIIDEQNKLYAELLDIKPDLELEVHRIINDYICLCFLIGNDFIPHLPGVSISNKGIDKLMNIYISMFAIRQKYLVNENNTINFSFMKQIITGLYDDETLLLRKAQKNTDRFRPRLRYDDSHGKELEELKFYPVFNKDNSIKMGYDLDWRDKYYKKYFSVDNYHKNKDYINQVCINYIEGLQWNAYYYLDKCPSYSWYYQYRGAPTLKDLAVFFIKRVYPVQFTNIEYSPLEQLSIVLPRQSSHLWAKEYRMKLDTDLKVQSMYPKDFQLDLLNHVYLHECDPILADLDGSDVKKIFSNIQLSELENILNEKTELITISNKV